MPDNLIILRTQFESVETERDLERLARKVRDFKKEQDLGSADQIRAGKLLNQIENEKHAWAKIGYSDNAKMKESYFSLGTELRSMYREQRLVNRTMGEMGGLVSLLGGNFRSAIDTFQGVNFALDGLTIGAKASGVAFASMLGPISILISVGAALYTFMDQSGDKAGKAAEKVDTLADAWKKYQQTVERRTKAEQGLETPAQERARLEAELAGLLPQATTPGWATLVPYTGPQGNGPFTPASDPRVREAGVKSDTQFQERMARVAEIRTRLAELNKQDAASIEKSIDAFKRADKETLSLFGALLGVSDIGEARSHVPYTFQRGTAISGLSPVVAPEIIRLNEQQIEDYGKEGERSMDAIRSGAVEAGGAITSYIVAPLREGLDDAGNLALTILGIAARTALIATGNAAYAGLVPFASGGSFYTTGPGFIPTSRGLAMVGESGPERVDVTPAREARQYGRGGGSGETVQFGVVKVGLTELSLAVERGDRLRAQTVFR